MNNATENIFQSILKFMQSTYYFDDENGGSEEAEEFVGGGEHTHAQALKIKGPYPMVYAGPDGIESDPEKLYYLIKVHYHATPNLPPHKSEVFVPAEMLGEVVRQLTAMHRFINYPA